MLKKIPVARLTLGMYLHDFGESWIDHPFWRARFRLTDPDDLRKIHASRIETVIIDTEKGADVDAAPARSPGAGLAGREPQAVAAGAPSAPAPAAATGDPPPAPARASALPSSHSLGEELGRARRLIQGARAQVVEMFSQARMGKVPDLGGLAPMVEEISASVDRNREALITLARLKTRDDYTFMHSVAVCGLMIALARELELDEAQRRTAGLAGLVHDIGKMFVPVELLNKPGRLSDAEFDLVRRHPREGWTLLRQVPGIVPEALDVCLHHHEKHAGGGYPDGLSGESISLMARMGAVCDVYDAVTSQRAYNRGWDPADALRQMAGWRGHFDPHVFQAFVRAVGIYPTGSLVRLASGRLGVVIEQGKTSLLAPRVRVFFSARSREPVPVQVIEPGGSDRIVAREDPAQWGFERLDEHWAAA